LDLSARDYVFSGRDLEDVSNTEELYHNLVIAAGLRFSFGGGFGPVRTPQPVPPAVTPVSEPVPAALEGPVEPIEEPEVKVVEAPAVQVSDTVASPVTEEKKQPIKEPAAAAAVTTEPESFHGERRVSIPVPTMGEIYVRYGRAGGVQIESRFEGREAPAAAGAPAKPQVSPTTMVPQAALPVPTDTLDAGALRNLIRSELAAMELRTRARAAQVPAAGPVEPDATADIAKPAEPYAGLTTEQQLELLERRLAERIDERVDKRVREMETRLPEPAPTTVVLPEERPAVTVVGPEAVQTQAQPFDWRPKMAAAYLGFGIDDPEQFVTGGRVDLGPLSRNSNVHFVPELSLGFGSSTTSFMLAANVRYDFRATERPRSWSPIVSAGVGILGFSDDVEDRSKQEGVLNLGYGLAANFGRVSGFLEHQGVDLFDLNRILFGLKWRL
jgi:hypothetical protein